MVRRIFIMLVCLSALAPLCSNAASSSPTKDWSLNLKEVEISAFLDQVSSITGENFVLDPQVRGKVSVIAPTPMNRDAVHELLLTVLRVNGLIAIPSGNTTRIVPQNNAKIGTTVKTVLGESGQQIITRVLPIKTGNVNDLVRMLKPLASPSGYLEGSEFSNAMIVSDYGDNVSQIVRALTALDKQQSASDVEVIQLKEAWVGNIVPLIEAIAPMQLEESGKPHNRLRVVADERNNSIIVRGDDKEREQIRQLVEKFDIRTNEASNIQIIHLQYADAKEVATLLRGMLSAKALQPSASSLPPQAAPQQQPASPASSGEDTSATQSAIQANITLNTIIIRAEPALMNEIRNLVKQLDVRRPQVLIEAAIVEITADKSENLGLQLGAGNSTATYNGGTTQFGASGLSIGSVLNQLGNLRASQLTNEGLAVTLGTKDGFNVLLQALASTTGANLLSTPSIITLDNEEAKIVVGQNVPFRTGSFSTQNSGTTNPFTTIERQDIGITLKVIPQIHEGNLVKMNIEQEVSSIAPTTVQTSGAADIVTNKRTIQTKVLAEDGETVVLGGLIEDDLTESTSQVPILGDIPVVGTLFKDKSHSSVKKNLLVFLRPTVLRGKEDMKEVTQKQYSKVYDLVLGQKTLDSLEQTTPSQSATPANNIFDVPPKKLPWLLDSSTTVTNKPSQGLAQEHSSVPSSDAPLPWLSNKTDIAAPTQKVEIRDTIPPKLTLTPPR